MNNIKPEVLFLEYNEFKTLDSPGQGKILLRCLEGSAWVTTASDPNDYFLDQGDLLELPEERVGVLLQSLSVNLIIEISRIGCENQNELMEQCS